jgi:hypothetical protein
MRSFDPARPRMLSLWMHGVLSTALAACSSAPVSPVADSDTLLSDTDGSAPPIDTDPTDAPIDSDAPVDSDAPIDSDAPVDSDEPVDSEVAADSGGPEETAVANTDLPADTALPTHTGVDSDPRTDTGEPGETDRLLHTGVQPDTDEPVHTAVVIDTFAPVDTVEEDDDSEDTSGRPDTVVLVDTTLVSETDVGLDTASELDTEAVLESPADSDTAGCSSTTDPNTLLPQALSLLYDTADTAHYDLDFALARSGCEWPGVAPTSPWENLCSWRGAVAEALNPSESIEHLVLLGYMAEMGYVDLELGTRCGDAADTGACLGDLNAVTGLWFTGRVMASTDGGAVRTWEGPMEVLGALGVIDTPLEASILVWSTSRYLWLQPFGCGPGEGWVRPVRDGYVVVASDLVSDCPVIYSRSRVHVTEDGTVTLLAEQLLGREGGCIGRPPPGLLPVHRLDGSEGDRFARHAAMEAASAVAFEHLICELQHHGAPPELVQGCVRAARDEERHASLVGQLARRAGREPRVAQIAPTPIRSLLDIALDNAVAGCVGETLGALAALAEAAEHPDPVVSATLRRIARDEVRHAALSWRLHRWLCGRLSGGEVVQVQAALREALASPAAAVGEGVSAELGLALAAAAGELALAA